MEEKNLKNAIFNHLITTVQSRADHIETFLDAKREAIIQLSESIVVRRVLLSSKGQEDYNQRLNDARQRIEKTSGVLKGFYNLFVLDKDGIVLVSSNKMDVGVDKSEDSYFSSAKTSFFPQIVPGMFTWKKLQKIRFSYCLMTRNYENLFIKTMFTNRDFSVPTPGIDEYIGVFDYTIQT